MWENIVTNITTEKITRLQHNLSGLRKLAGLTAQDLGVCLGITKQSISNLETGKVKMSKAQYIAIRVILDFFMTTTNNMPLELALSMVLDNANGTDKDLAKNEEKVKIAGAAARAGVVDDILMVILSDYEEME